MLFFTLSEAVSPADGGLLFGSSLSMPRPGPWQGTRWLHSKQSLEDLLGELGWDFNACR